MKRLLFALLTLTATVALADVPLPANILDPKTTTEAWNVIHLSTANVERLIGEKRLTEIPVQISLCSAPLRTLAKLEATPEGVAAVKQQTDRLAGWVIAIARMSGENNQTATEDGFKMLTTLLKELGQRYDPKVVAGDIFFCPMHPEFIAPKPDVPCPKCGMALFKRRIPYSFIYTTPGEPSITITAAASAPVEAGKKMEVKVRLVHKDGKPVLLSDLLVMHTEPIHLLIEEPSFGDYHHEHPVATDTPGEYAFSFTPKKTSPYRIWADIVPSATGVQEMPFTDLRSSGQAATITDTASTFTSTVDGYQFALTFANGNHLPIAAGQTHKMAITITDPNGQPMKSLEPFMTAFAHLVGFYDDYQTVVHLHPAGGDILNPAARGGPALGFQFFPPKAGFIRMYCQVQIGGKMLFAPFNVNVTP